MNRRWVMAALLCVAASPAQGPASHRTSAQSPAGAADAARVDAMIADAKTVMLDDPRRAVVAAVAAIREASTLADRRQRTLSIATAQWLEGEAYLRLGDDARAEPLVRDALAKANRVAPGGQLTGDALLTRGSISRARGDVAAALADYQAAHRIFLAAGLSRSQSMALMIIALLYNDARDNVSALRYFDQAIDAYHGDPNLEIAIFNNRGGIYQDMGRYAEAEAQFGAALTLARKAGSDRRLAQILGNIARNRLKAGQVGRARQSLQQAMTLAQKGEAAAMRPQMLAIAAQGALQSGDPQRAKTLIEDSLAGVDLATTTLPFREAHQTAYNIYTALHEPADAMLHLAALKRLDDQATKLATDTSTALMAARFNFANQEVKIAKLNADEARRSAAFERARAVTQRYVFLGAALATSIVIAMLGFALFTSRRSRDRVRAANADLAITNHALGKALAAKTEFLATTSHEIRTPLNGILGMTQVMMADAALTAEMRDRLGVVQGAGETMRALVDDILDVAKMESGRLTIEEVDFDLRAAITDATRLWEAQAQTKGIAFAANLADCPTIVRGDVARVRQIVFNLLSNAIKFTATGGVTLTVTADEDGAGVRIAVADTGIGIPPEKQEEIFEAFRQADAGTTRQFGGTGLGLAICRNLVEAMDGRIELTSVEGEGSVFTAVLPLKPASVTPVAAPAGTAEGEAVALPALLIVDRNPITRSMFRTLFAPHAGTVMFAGTIDEAVAQLAATRPARMLIDDATVRAAGDDPIATVARLAQAAQASGTTGALLWPIAADSERDALLATGIGRVIAKPITGAALVATLWGTDAVGDVNGQVAPLVSRAA